MFDRRRLALLAVVALVVAGAAYAVESSNDERTTVTFADENGTTLASADVAVSDTLPERDTGLSDTNSLGPNEGMLFVHPSEGNHTYVMREMAFPIDIVFVAADGTITTIHHAELPDDDEKLQGYAGRGKYVIELPYSFTNRTGIEVGDTIQIPGQHRTVEG
ncbi:protein of unknown function DUF192 [halophilic archaeon DL31]|nr:protein of unknown function DUF192 [halophilic archaeon DL31]